MATSSKVEDQLLQAIEISNALAQGRELYYNEHFERPTEEQVIWWLLCEAARTEKAIGRSGPKIQRRHGVDYTHTTGEVFAARIEGDDKRPVFEDTAKPVPSAGELTRYEIVFPWLAYVRGRDPKRRREMVWALASGASPTNLSVRYGLGSRQAVLFEKKTAIKCIAGALQNKMGTECG